jgi:hypothetical protein
MPVSSERPPASRNGAERGRKVDAAGHGHGTDKIEATERAVDMPLRLDNANALPTYPQQKQKQQEAA